MSLWSRLSNELHTAGRAAQGAIDEGKVRLELFRMGQLCDKAAQALGYAVHRARRDGREAEADLVDRLDATLSTHEAELKRLEGVLAMHTAGASRPPTDPPANSPTAAPAGPTPSSSPPAA